MFTKLSGIVMGIAMIVLLFDAIPNNDWIRMITCTLLIVGAVMSQRSEFRNK